jgi:hypothetical protein
MIRLWWWWNWASTGPANLLGEVLRTRALPVDADRRALSLVGHRGRAVTTGHRARLVE